MSKNSWWNAKNALMSKPEGDDTRYCGSCRGEGCRDCRGWGWEHTPGYCELPASGNECGDCSKMKGCQR